MIVDQSEKIKKRKAWKLKIRDGEGKFKWKWLDFKITALPSVPLVILFQKKEDEFWPTSKLQESRKLIEVVVVDRARLSVVWVMKVEGLSHYNFNLVQLSEQFSFRSSAKKTWFSYQFTPEPNAMPFALISNS